MKRDLDKKIFRIKNDDEFNTYTFEVFQYQRKENPVYRRFLELLGKEQTPVNSVRQIPFMPAELFRNNRIVTGKAKSEFVFKSSRTGGDAASSHHVADIELYKRSLLTGFRLFYGEPSEYAFMALLPSYAERADSSLIFMVKELISKSNHPLSGFYHNDVEKLLSSIAYAKEAKVKTILIGVSFALLDLAEKTNADLSGITVMETGGMKGRRKEITRSELHSILKSKFNLNAIHSEYGMTELLSQAYSRHDGIFCCPPWMKVLIRDSYDPLTNHAENGKTGCINIIDLANIYSCSFIATSDLGKIRDDGGFEVLGRHDYSDIRGCNLLAE
jgi:hypothetical protein